MEEVSKDMCCFVASPIICFLAPKECHRYTNNTLFINILRRDFHSFNDARHQRRTVMPAWSVPAPACMCVFQYKCTRTRTPDGTGAGCRAHSIADRSPQYLQRVIRFVRNTERERDEKKKKKIHKHILLSGCCDTVYWLYYYVSLPVADKRVSAIQTACRHRRRCDAMYAPAHATNRNNQKPKEHNAKIIIMNTLKKKNTNKFNLLSYSRGEAKRNQKKKSEQRKGVSSLLGSNWLWGNKS